MQVLSLSQSKSSDYLKYLSILFKIQLCFCCLQDTLHLNIKSPKLKEPNDQGKIHRHILENNNSYQSAEYCIIPFAIILVFNSEYIFIWEPKLTVMLFFVLTLLFVRVCICMIWLKLFVSIYCIKYTYGKCQCRLLWERLTWLHKQHRQEHGICSVLQPQSAMIPLLKSVEVFDHSALVSQWGYVY